jgi:PHD/YefM family antitoxin component YafN of YafNO toxin-antitoxin module
MTTVSTLEFQRNVRRFQDEAGREPVVITDQGQRALVLISADHYDWLSAAAQRTHRTTDAFDAIIAAVERAEMGTEHAHLDNLLT